MHRLQCQFSVLPICTICTRYRMSTLLCKNLCSDFDRPGVLIAKASILTQNHGRLIYCDRQAVYAGCSEEALGHGMAGTKLVRIGR